jgi:hypothetical protein
MFIVLQSFHHRMFHATEKGFKATKKKSHSSSEMPPFLLALAKVSRVRKKERKIYRGIKNANRGLRFFASSSSSNKPKRKQTGRCAEAQGLVVVGSKSPKSRRAKRIPFFPSVSPPQSRSRNFVKRPCCFG